ncbi:Ubiquitin conjugation factor E4 B [Phytophthora boehmeriae]|uniref:Ubiquitin conjugation factor E4 B n=1 Tax=Phytophthora boehmeriae TaxID=109152 RepID=A0A8T1VUE1_9STRA|nr:Ubiquitin conjugation factor E4 B [Phytophthora boehmeriae]
MFLCAREASTGPSGAPPHAQDALNSVVNVPATSESQSSRQSRVLTSKRSIGRSPEASEDGDSSAYLQVLNALTRLVAQLLDVHTLSPALRFSAGEQVAVDAVEWWKEVQKQSIALVQRLQASAAAEGGDEDNHTTAEVTTTSLWSLASPQQQQKPQEQQEKTDNQISMLQCEAFAELPEDKASGFCIQALYLVMRALERVNRRKEQRQEQDGAEGLDGETLAKAFATVDSGVAFAAAQLLQSWVAMDQTADIALPLSDLMGVAVVNAMLQSRKIGTRHTFHKHTLLASLARRAFPRDKEWSCSVCNRVTPTTGYPM